MPPAEVLVLTLSCFIATGCCLPLHDGAAAAFPRLPAPPVLEPVAWAGSPVQPAAHEPLLTPERGTDVTYSLDRRDVQMWMFEGMTREQIERQLLGGRMLEALAAEEKHGVDLVKPHGTSMVDVPIVSNAADLSADAAPVTVYTRPAQDVLEASFSASSPGDVVWEPTSRSEPDLAIALLTFQAAPRSLLPTRYAIWCPDLVAALGTGAASIVPCRSVEQRATWFSSMEHV